MSTVDNCFVLHSLISHCLNTNKKLYAAFADFKKAFDYVVRDVVWYKLIKAGVRGKILNVIQAMYNTIKSGVKFDNELSNDFVSCIGVRQGECLSPFLFSMYLNDIEKEVKLRLHDNCVQNWNTRINESSGANSFSIFLS